MGMLTGPDVLPTKDVKSSFIVPARSYENLKYIETADKVAGTGFENAVVYAVLVATMLLLPVQLETEEPE